MGRAALAAALFSGTEHSIDPAARFGI
ncbi:hypothetical protein B14911_26445 [Bacillus sp. NRRL B-14911]|nr:hypothetical protein B14911_26445 [Bacillus sp. NRRL B-14911]